MAPNDASYAPEPLPGVFFSTLLSDLTPQSQIKSRPLSLGETRPLLFREASSMWENEVFKAVHVVAHFKALLNRLGHASCTNCGVVSFCKPF